MKKYSITLIIIIGLIFPTIFVGSASSIHNNGNIVYDVEKIDVSFNSSGYNLTGEIYFPSNENGPFPGVVCCEGLCGYLDVYNWIPASIAENGYVAIIFDFPAQGHSEGFLPNWALSISFLNIYLRFTALFEFPFHYLIGEWVTATSDALTYLTEESPVKNLVNSSNIGLIGHSYGGITVTETAAVDKRFDAVVALSQGNTLKVNKIDVPIQFQGGFFDIGTYSIPIIWRCYKKANSPKELITIQQGTHFGFSTAFGKFCPCPKWQKEIVIHYAVGWFDYFLKNKPDAYIDITTGNDHLSKIVRSRFNFGDGEHILR